VYLYTSLFIIVTCAC